MTLARSRSRASDGRSPVGLAERGRPTDGTARFAAFGAGTLLYLAAAAGVAAEGPADLAPILGTWRGSSICVNRELAPACNDETVVYDVRPSGKPGVATLKADKIVDGKRATMGELDFAYDSKTSCWRSEFSTPRFHGVWCLTIQGPTMTGSLRVLPDEADVRRVQLKRE